MLQKLKVTSYALIILLLLVLPSQAVAQCNTQDACAAAAQAKGLILGGSGYAFSGSYQTKGCYSYNGGKYSGMAYFGTGGSPAQMEAAPAAPKYRISCGAGPMTGGGNMVAAQDNVGVCEPVERIRNMKDTARHSDYKKWEERCQVSGSNGTCGNRAERPVGDGGRCEMTTADTVATPDVNPNAVPENSAAQSNTAEVCYPVERIRNMKDTARHSDYKKWEERCQVSGSNGTCGNRAKRPVGDGGRCEMTTADTVALDVKESIFTPKQEERILHCKTWMANNVKRNASGRQGYIPVGPRVLCGCYRQELHLPALDCAAIQCASGKWSFAPQKGKNWPTCKR
jgi:hypothetical protein